MQSSYNSAHQFEWQNLISPTVRRILLTIMLIGAPSIGIAGFFIPFLNLPVLTNPLFHMIIVSFVALVGVILALLVLRVARQSGDGRVLILGLSMLSGALFFLIHAFTTPNALIGSNNVVRISSQLMPIFGGFVFALGGLPINEQANRIINRLAPFLVFAIVIGWALISADMGGMQLMMNHTMPMPMPAQSITNQINFQQFWAFSVAAYFSGALRYHQIYRRDPSLFGLALVYGGIMLAAALSIQSVSKTYSTLFWTYHLLEVSGFGVIAAAVLTSRQLGQTNEIIFEGLFLPGTRARIQANYAHALDELIQALENGAQPNPVLRATLRGRFGLTESQIQVLERAASAVAQERQQRAELERLNATLRQVEQDKEHLTQMVIHDLKNPLTALVGYLDVLRLDDLTSDQRMLVEGALRSGKNLSGLIGDLLDIAQLEEGHLPISHERFLACLFLEECAQELRFWASQYDKRLISECPADLTILGDPRLLRRVIFNLLSNAIKHTQNGAQIAIQASQPAPEWIMLQVTDNGPGIATENLGRIFQRFEHGAEALGQQENTGLGLPFCKMVAEAHGGTIKVESTLGQGATFSLLLPAQ